MTQRAPLTLIVGMHRSGTSLLGSLLPACGIAMPGPLLAGDTHNPEGYFERADVTALQEQLLIDLDRWWPSPRMDRTSAPAYRPFGSTQTNGASSARRGTTWMSSARTSWSPFPPSTPPRTRAYTSI